MGIFSRRKIQNCLNENKVFLTKQQINEHLNKLNLENHLSIPCEWEVILLNALSKTGKLEHERSFDGGTSYPDIYYTSNRSELCFVADITTISDQAANDKNPIRYFMDEVYSYLKKKGIEKGIDIKVFGERIGQYGNQKIQLLLPEKAEIPRFLKRSLFNFAQSILDQPDKFHKIEVEYPPKTIQISYNPKEIYNSGGYPVFTLPLSLKNNPLYNRLKSKAQQLKKANFRGLNGLFICDGGCDLLNKKSSLSSGEYSQDEIIHNFFREQSTIDFLCILSIEEQLQSLSPFTRDRFIFISPYFTANMESHESNQLYQEIEKFIKFLPKPDSTLANAIYRLGYQLHQGITHYREISYYEPSCHLASKIKFSSRELTELMAGTLKVEDFDIDAPIFKKENSLKKVCQKVIESKIAVTKISIEITSEVDDDWITIKFNLQKKLESFPDFHFNPINERQLEISSFILIQALAGNLFLSKSSSNSIQGISQEEIDKIRTFFRQKIEEGRMIHHFEQINSADWNTVAIIFTNRDAAISPYF